MGLLRHMPAILLIWVQGGPGDALAWKNNNRESIHDPPPNPLPSTSLEPPAIYPQLISTGTLPVLRRAESMCSHRSNMHEGLARWILWCMWALKSGQSPIPLLERLPCLTSKNSVTHSDWHTFPALAFHPNTILWHTCATSMCYSRAGYGNHGLTWSFKKSSNGWPWL